MSLWLNFLLSIPVHAIFFFVVGKGLTGDWKMHTGENLYIGVASLLLAIVRMLVLQLDFPNLSGHVFNDTLFLMLILLYVPSLFLYFYKVKSYSAKKSTTLMSALIVIIVGSDFILDLVFAAFFPSMRLHRTMTLAQYPLQIILHILFHGALAAVLTLLLVKSTWNLRRAISQNARKQTILLCASMATLFLVTGTLFVFYSEAATWFEGDWPWPAVLTFALMYLLLVGSFFHTRMLRTRYEQQRKETELQSLKHYTEELERQQIAMRKFKHDYQNMLLSISEFVYSGDLQGLQQYYSSSVEAAAEIITKDTSVLDGLGKVKVPEIKSILAAKLMMAQNTDMGIRTMFEANEDIDHISVDSLVLVRMLGIILDNAIEALAELGGGELFVGCYKWEAGITFIVQNTCPPDTPPPQQLWKPGFSTKGDNRGLGLFNLSELADSCPNVTLKTSVREGNFSQELLIEQREEAEIA